MRLTNRATTFAACFCCALVLAWAQTPSSQPVATSDLTPGIVIEKVAKYSEGEKAGLAEGDVLVGWKRGDASGVFRSPFDLVTVEIEQAPRGTVILDGLRGSGQRRWPLGPDNWGIQTRPNFQESLLAIYREGQALAVSGNQSEAAQKWRAMAGSFDPGLLRSWLLFHTARLHAEAKQWNKSDEAYQEAIYASSGAGPDVEMQLLISWAHTFLKRSDSARAEKYYREAVQKESFGPDSLARALALEYLAHAVRARGDVIKAEDYYLQTWRIRDGIAPGSLAEASSLYDLGGVENDQGRLDKSEDYYRQALVIREKLSPGNIEVARNMIGLANLALLRSDLTQAEDYYRGALAIFENREPGSLDVADAFTGLGCVAYNRGDLAQEEDFFAKALAIKEKLAPASLTVAVELHNLAVVASDRGDLARAEQFYRKALQIEERLAPGSLNLAATLNNLGGVAYDRGDLTSAEHFYSLALTIRKKLSPGSLDVAATLDNLGTVAREQGDLSRAEDLQRQALEILEKLSPDSLGAATNLSNLGQVAYRRGDLAKAEKYELRALATKEKLSQTSVSLGSSLNYLAAMAKTRGDFEQAEQYYRRAFAIWAQLAPGSANQAESVAGLASIMRQRGQLDAAAQLYDQALHALEGQTSRLGGTEEVRAGFRAKYETYYQDYADLLVLQGKTDYAFRVLERSRARTLLEMLASAHLDIHRGADPALLQQERSLRENITAKSDRRIRLLGDKHSAEQITEIDKEISDLRDQYQALEAQIRATSPGYAALTEPQSLTAEQVRDLLDGKTVLLEYSLGEDRSYVFAVTPDSVVARELPKRAEIERLARSVYDALTARNHTIKSETQALRQARWAKADRSYARLAAQLSRMVLAPVAADITGKRLLVISDGALQYIPFAALPDPANASAAPVPLIVSHEVVNLPSASVLAVLRRQQQDRKPAPKAVAVLADPVFSARDARLAARSDQRQPGLTRSATDVDSATASSDPRSNTFADELLTRSVRDVGLELSRLPFTRREAEAIMSLASPGQGMEALDFQATRATAVSPELAQYRIVHFATHGLLDSQHPELSGLVLSLVDRRGKPQSGFLALEDIYNLDLPAELVVLSACETGLGKEISGEGLIGLTRGFMYAGANRVVASLWNVNDVATAELMARFYQGMFHGGLAPAAALRQAQAQMWRRARWKSPYYWAAFQIQGDWK